MADPKPSIFNKRAAERLRSPDDLDRYVRATNASSWVVLVGVLVLLLGLLSWGVFGSVSTTVSTEGVCIDGQTLCLLSTDQAANVMSGDPAYVNGMQAKVASISELPLSRDEARKVLAGDYLVDALMPGDWAYLVYIEDVEPEKEGVPLAVSIATERVAPISLVLG